jgi:hypothetical protein
MTSNYAAPAKIAAWQVHQAIHTVAGSTPTGITLLNRALPGTSG